MKKQNGISLIVLVITIVVLIILAGVGVNLTIGENGILKKVREINQKESEILAIERLELLLVDAKIERETNINYNSDDFLTKLLQQENITVNGDVVIVNNYKFLIDRENLKILEGLGEVQIKITTEVQEYLGKNENNKYTVSIFLLIESNINIQRVVIQNPDGTTFEIKTEQKKIAKDMEVELNEEYILTVIGENGKEYNEKIKIESIAKIKNIETHTGASYIDINLDVETIEGVNLKYTYIVGENQTEELTTNTYTQEDLEEKTRYNIKVIVTDETGYFSQMITTEVTTQEKLYLYNNGEEYTETTGGWIKAFSTYSGTGEKKNSYLYCYSPIHTEVFSTYYFRTTNKIDLEEYRKMYCKVSVTVHRNGSGGHFAMFGTWNGSNYTYYRGMIREPNMSNFTILNGTVSNRKVIVDISELKDELYITAGISSGGAYDSISANIYEVWLEK